MTLATMKTQLTNQVWTVFSLQNHLRELSGLPLVIMITTNTHTMISIKHTRRSCTVRLHKMFLSAPDAVLAALARWLRTNEKSDHEMVQQYIRQHHGVLGAKRRQKKLSPVGEIYDLDAVAERMNNDFLDHRSQALITWGKEISKKRAHRMLLGSFEPASGIITISQRLDSCEIPRYVVEYIVFHEMLHEVLGVNKRTDGKRDVHGRTFKLMEQTYPLYQLADEFIQRKWGGK